MAPSCPTCTTRSARRGHAGSARARSRRAQSVSSVVVSGQRISSRVAGREHRAVRVDRRRVGQERGPAGHVGGGAPELRGRADRAEVGRRLGAGVVGVGVDQVAGRRVRPAGSTVVAARPSGPSTRSASTSAQVPPRSRATSVAEQRHGQVGVVEAAGRRQHPLGPVQVGEQLVGVRARAACPRRRRTARAAGRRCARAAGGRSARRAPARRGAAPIGSSRSSSPSSRACSTSTAVKVLVTEPIRNGVCGPSGAVVAGAADRECPERTVGAVQRDRERGDPAVGLRLADRPARSRVERRAHSRASIGPSGAPPSTCACAWKTSWPPYAPVLKINRKPSPRSPSASATVGGRRPAASPASSGSACASVDHVDVVLLRDHQDVHRRLRGDVAEGERGVGLADHRRRDLAGHDPAEQAVSLHSRHRMPLGDDDARDRTSGTGDRSIPGSRAGGGDRVRRGRGPGGDPPPGVRRRWRNNSRRRCPAPDTSWSRPT